MVAALSLPEHGLTAEDLDQVSTHEVGLLAAATVLYQGLDVVQRAAEQDRHAGYSDESSLGRSWPPASGALTKY